MYSQKGELKLKKGNLLKNLTKMGKEWQISFDFNPENFDDSGFTNILHLTIGQDHSDHVVGNRIPAIFYHRKRGLHVTYAIGNKPNYYKDIPNIPLKKWTKIVLSQSKSGSVTNFKIQVPGAAPVSVENPAPQDFSNVKVYAADPWWNTQPGAIRKLSIKTK